MVANENSAYKVMWLATSPTLLGTLLVDMGAVPIPELELGGSWLGKLRTNGGIPRVLRWA